jgi:hypothetical protein
MVSATYLSLLDDVYGSMLSWCVEPAPAMHLGELLCSLDWNFGQKNPSLTSFPFPPWVCISCKCARCVLYPLPLQWRSFFFVHGPYLWIYNLSAMAFF